MLKLVIRRTRSAVATVAVISIGGGTLAAGTAQAQQAAAAVPDNGPKVGDMAPDFTLPTATRDRLGKPLTLSSLRGRTVVIAFFPRARTSGCTAQMEAYRDQWATVFNDGKDVTVLAISTDSAAVQQAWAQEKGFPVTFVSDVDAVAGKAYDVAVERNGAKLLRRVLYVIGPDGRVQHTMRPFRELAADSYTELAAAVKKAGGL